MPCLPSNRTRPPSSITSALQEAEQQQALNEGIAHVAFETLLRETARDLKGRSLVSELGERRERNRVEHDGVLRAENRLPPAAVATTREPAAYRFSAVNVRLLPTSRSAITRSISSLKAIASAGSFAFISSIARWVSR